MVVSLAPVEALLHLWAPAQLARAPADLVQRVLGWVQGVEAGSVLGSQQSLLSVREKAS